MIAFTRCIAEGGAGVDDLRTIPDDLKRIVLNENNHFGRLDDFASRTRAQQLAKNGEGSINKNLYQFSENIIQSSKGFEITTHKRFSTTEADKKRPQVGGIRVKASKLIALLQDLVKANGDLDVVVDCPGMMATRAVDEVDYVEEDGIVIWPITAMGGISE